MKEEEEKKVPARGYEESTTKYMWWPTAFYKSRASLGFGAKDRPEVNDHRNIHVRPADDQRARFERFPGLGRLSCIQGYENTANRSRRSANLDYLHSPLTWNTFPLRGAFPFEYFIRAKKEMVIRLVSRQEEASNGNVEWKYVLNMLIREF